METRKVITVEPSISIISITGGGGVAIFCLWSDILDEDRSHRNNTPQPLKKDSESLKPKQKNTAQKKEIHTF